MMSLPYILIILCGIAGFLLSNHIRQKKKTEGKIVCPLKAKCDEVLFSKYSKFLGIPLEYIGLFYYGIITLSYIFLLGFPSLITPAFTFVVIGLTTTALLFSVYLTFIQAIALKQYCSWCLMSAGLSTIIFIAMIVGMTMPFTALLSQFSSMLLLVHLLGMALGLGAATMVDLFFFKFLKDLRISEDEASIIHTITQVIWFGLAVALVTGLALYIPESAKLLTDVTFLLKTTVIGILVVVSALNTILVVPKLVKISYQQEHDHRAGELHYNRKLAYIFGSTTIISWYVIFGLSVMSIPGTYSMLFLVYILLIACGATVGLIADKKLSTR